MNDNELNNMLSDFFSKANLAPGKSTDTLEPNDATRPDEKQLHLFLLLKHLSGKQKN